MGPMRHKESCRPGDWVGGFQIQSRRRLCLVQSERSWAIASNPGTRFIKLGPSPHHRRCRPIRSHEAATRRVQRPLQAQGRVRGTRAYQRATQQFAEETEHVPVVLGGTLEVAAAPAPAHQGGQRAPGPETQPLPVPLVAYYEDGRLGCARRPGGQMGMRAAVPDTDSPRPENAPPPPQGGICTLLWPESRPGKHETHVAQRPHSWQARHAARTGEEPTHYPLAKAQQDWQKLPSSAHRHLWPRPYLVSEMRCRSAFT